MFIQEKIKDINERLHVLENKKNVIIWGAGIHTAQLLEKTDLLSYKIVNVVDMNICKQGKSYFGFNIKEPKEISWDDVGAVVVSAPGKEEQIIDSLIQKFCYSGEIITLYGEDEHTPFYMLYDKQRATIFVEGDYGSWAEAYAECKGYEDENILTRAIAAVQKVISGEAAWERDGWLFYEKKYVYHLCAAILRCAVKNHNCGVKILDIGGALGSTYFQNKEYLADVKNLQYIIAEQEQFADYGHRNLENGTLRFINSADDYCIYGRPDIVLLSGSLQFIYPYEKIIDKILRAEPNYIILDRIMIGNRRRVCKETVLDYSASYPMTVFREDEILALFYPRYRQIEKDVSSVPGKIYFSDGIGEARYFVFERILL